MNNSEQVVNGEKAVCNAIRKDGKPCTAKVIADGKCLGHGKHGFAANPEFAREQAIKRNLARGERARKRQLEREMSLRDKIAARLEDKSGPITDRLMEIVMTGTHADALRATDMLMNRTYGKPTEHLVTESSTDPEDMTLGELERARKTILDEVLADATNHVRPLQ